MLIPYWKTIKRGSSQQLLRSPVPSEMGDAQPWPGHSDPLRFTINKTWYRQQKLHLLKDFTNLSMLRWNCLIISLAQHTWVCMLWIFCAWNNAQCLERQTICKGGGWWVGRVQVFCLLQFIHVCCSYSVHNEVRLDPRPFETIFGRVLVAILVETLFYTPLSLILPLPLRWETFI